MKTIKKKSKSKKVKSKQNPSRKTRAKSFFKILSKIDKTNSINKNSLELGGSLEKSAMVLFSEVLGYKLRGDMVQYLSHLIRFDGLRKFAISQDRFVRESLPQILLDDVLKFILRERVIPVLKKLNYHTDYTYEDQYADKYLSPLDYVLDKTRDTYLKVITSLFTYLSSGGDISISLHDLNVVILERQNNDLVEKRMDGIKAWKKYYPNIWRKMDEAGAGVLVFKKSKLFKKLFCYLFKIDQGLINDKDATIPALEEVNLRDTIDIYYRSYRELSRYIKGFTYGPTIVQKNSEITLGEKAVQLGVASPLVLTRVNISNSLELITFYSTLIALSGHSMNSSMRYNQIRELIIHAVGMNDLFSKSWRNFKFSKQSPLEISAYINYLDKELEQAIGDDEGEERFWAKGAGSARQKLYPLTKDKLHWYKPVIKYKDGMFWEFLNLAGSNLEQPAGSHCGNMGNVNNPYMVMFSLRQPHKSKPLWKINMTVVVKFDQPWKIMSFGYGSNKRIAKIEMYESKAYGNNRPDKFYKQYVDLLLWLDTNFTGLVHNDILPRVSAMSGTLAHIDIKEIVDAKLFDISGDLGTIPKNNARPEDMPPELQEIIFDKIPYAISRKNFDDIKCKDLQTVNIEGLTNDEVQFKIMRAGQEALERYIDWTIESKNFERVDFVKLSEELKSRKFGIIITDLEKIFLTMKKETVPSVAEEKWISGLDRYNATTELDYKRYEIISSDLANKVKEFAPIFLKRNINYLSADVLVWIFLNPKIAGFSLNWKDVPTILYKRYSALFQSASHKLVMKSYQDWANTNVSYDQDGNVVRPKLNKDSIKALIQKAKNGFEAKVKQEAETGIRHFFGKLDVMKKISPDEYKKILNSFPFLSENPDIVFHAFGESDEAISFYKKIIRKYGESNVTNEIEKSLIEGFSTFDKKFQLKMLDNFAFLNIPIILFVVFDVEEAIKRLSRNPDLDSELMRSKKPNFVIGPNGKITHIKINTDCTDYPPLMLELQNGLQDYAGVISDGNITVWETGMSNKDLAELYKDTIYPKITDKASKDFDYTRKFYNKNKATLDKYYEAEYSKEEGPWATEEGLELISILRHTYLNALEVAEYDILWGEIQSRIEEYGKIEWLEEKKGDKVISKIQLIIPYDIELAKVVAEYFTDDDKDDFYSYWVDHVNDDLRRFESSDRGYATPDGDIMVDYFLDNYDL